MTDELMIEIDAAIAALAKQKENKSLRSNHGIEEIIGAMTALKRSLINECEAAVRVLISQGSVIASVNYQDNVTSVRVFAYGEEIIMTSSERHEILAWLDGGNETAFGSALKLGPSAKRIDIAQKLSEIFLLAATATSIFGEQIAWAFEPKKSTLRAASNL